MLNISYDVTQMWFPVAYGTSSENLHNSNVFLQLFGVHASYIL